jgi:hypothetical protein
VATITTCLYRLINRLARHDTRKIHSLSLLSGIFSFYPGGQTVFSNSSEPMTRGTYTRAFVIKFAPETNLSANVAEGKVEHVSSGNTFQFRSLPQLLAFIDRVLKEGAASPVSFDVR